MDELMITQVAETQDFDWQAYMLVCMPDFVEAPPVDDSLDFDSILAELEADGGTAYGLIPWWLVEDERIGYELSCSPWLW